MVITLVITIIVWPPNRQIGMSIRCQMSTSLECPELNAVFEK